MSFASGLKTIVVATELTGRSEAALEYARKLAAAYGARIVLAHGIDPMEYAAVDAVPGRVLKGLTEEARAVLDKLSGDLLREGIHSHSEIRQGAVAQMLLDVARQYQAGLIVIGTKGMEGAGPVIVGAIAEQLVRLSPCPVLAVAADWNAGAFRPTPGGPVLLAMERNEASAAAMATASSLARVFERPLLVLHARTPAEAAENPDPCAATLEEFGPRVASRLPGALHRQRRQPGRRHRRGNCRESSVHSGGRRQALERHAGAAWHRLRPAGPLACAGSLRTAGIIPGPGDANDGCPSSRFGSWDTSNLNQPCS